MDIRELNLETMANIAGALGEGGTFAQFDRVMYELIEAGLLEAESGNYGRAVWEGKEIEECEGCQEITIEPTQEESSGLKMCSGCLEEEGN
jgi:hypothetical protein